MQIRASDIQTTVGLQQVLYPPILASVVAANALLLADLMSVSLLNASPYGGGTPRCNSLRKQRNVHHELHQLRIIETHLILDRALRATLIVPNGSFDFLATMSASKSSRKITHFVTGCIIVSKLILSHQACNETMLAKCTCE